MTPEERKQLQDGLIDAMKKHGDEITTLVRKHDEDLKTYGAVQDGTKTAIAELNTKGTEIQQRLLALEQKSVAEPQPALQAKSVGQTVIESDQMKGLSASGAGKVRIGVKAITSLGTAGVGVVVQRQPGVIQEPLMRLTIRDLLSPGRTSSNMIEYIRENVFTNSADVVSEGTLKPESTITFERADVGVKTIAHWMQATRQILADFPQLSSLIDGRLRYGLQLVEEREILLGDGTGEHLLGIIPQATAYNTAYTETDDTQLDIIRHAILQVRESFYPSTGIVMSPHDWHDIELKKDGEQRYLMAQPQGRLSPMLWGLPVVESDAMEYREFLVGAFALAATLFDREDATVQVSTEDRDNFVRNLVTILAEERLALAVFRPRAFVHGSMPATAST
jgi:HK97 family phage major capsid protein